MGGPHGARPFVTPLLGLPREAQGNLDYYQRVAGMRFVKSTVNWFERRAQP